MRIAFVFPGQGSQSVGMLSGFADNAVVTDYMARANAALGEDLVKLIAEGPAEVLSLTMNTQPALLAASAAFYEAWIAAGGRRPDVMAGHSLGEYSALTSAGTFAFEDAVKLVRFRAQAMQEAVPVGVGGMAAVIGLDDEAVIEACREASAVGRWGSRCRSAPCCSRSAHGARRAEWYTARSAPRTAHSWDC